MSDVGDEIRVLHVDDEPDFAEMAASYLERDDDRISVSTAMSAGTGQEYLEDHEIDCIVSDYDMPGTNGIEFLETVRERYPDLPFILFTGKGSEEVASDAISAGVTDYLQKESGTGQYELLANRIRNAVAAYRAKLAVEDSERRLRRVYERVTHGVFGVNTDWEYIYANEEGARLVGRSKDELLGHEVWEVFPELLGTPFEDALRRGMEEKEPTSVEEYYPPHETWYDVRVYPDTEGISIYFRDVTDRKQREQQLEREREQFEALYANFPEPTITYEFVEGEPVIRAVNDSFVEVFGFDAETAVGTSVNDLLVPPDYESQARNLDERVQAGELIDTELQRKTADGVGDFWFRNIPVPGSDPPDGFAVYADISDRMARERELERYETIVETAGDPVYTLDPDGHFTYVNEAMAQLTGYDAATLIGEHGSMVMSDDHVERAEELIRSLLSSDRIRGTFEMDLITADGEHIRCENHIGLLPFDEDFRGTVGILRDISDRIERERELERQNERLEEFAGVLSHDLRNPMNVAAGQVSLAMEECDSEHLDVASESIERMETLIDNMLSLARAGNAMSETAPIDLGRIVDACWVNVDSASATLVNETDRTIRADDSRLRQLLENLLRNAVEHGGDDVTITVGNLPTGFYVEDDGPGITEDDPDQVFEIGYSSTDDGTGFGLSIVRDIAEAHDWNITVGTGEDGGARFEITGVEFE